MTRCLLAWTTRRKFWSGLPEPGSRRFCFRMVLLQRKGTRHWLRTLGAGSSFACKGYRSRETWGQEVVQGWQLFASRHNNISKRLSCLVAAFKPSSDEIVVGRVCNAHTWLACQFGPVSLFVQAAVASKMRTGSFEATHAAFSPSSEDPPPIPFQEWTRGKVSRTAKLT